ncbi:hypothetical protein BGZ60DRAFT_409268 [Tricladium varicosporioides]|nr:hypothetical protein BGZ60DRAFT_409268 [Hymenoscyphus varicosporioides]
MRAATIVSVLALAFTVSATYEHKPHTSEVEEPDEDCSEAPSSTPTHSHPAHTTPSIIKTLPPTTFFTPVPVTSPSSTPCEETTPAAKPTTYPQPIPSTITEHQIQTITSCAENVVCTEGPKSVPPPPPAPKPTTTAVQPPYSSNNGTVASVTPKPAKPSSTLFSIGTSVSAKPVPTTSQLAVSGAQAVEMQWAGLVMGAIAGVMGLL